MICVSIAQESRRLALADMLNAVMSGADMLEVRLDRFEKAPDFSELLAARRKPVIFSCRREQDGGNWNAGEDERLALLRQAVVAGADYAEIELDAADQVRKFGKCQRVISYTNLTETPAHIGEIYAEAQTKQPDVIKLVCKARTPEEAWPLVQILAKPSVPTVVVGLGRPGVMLTVLGRKIGAPWAYAALERGSEAYPGQPTVLDLAEVYHYRAIDRSTRLFGVTGLGEREYVTTALLNAAFAELKQPLRCLPLQIGKAAVFQKVIGAVKLAGVCVDSEHYSAIRDVAGSLDESAELTKAADVILPHDGGWRGGNTLGPAALDALEATMSAHGKTLKGAVVMVVGVGPAARMLLAGLKERGAAPVVTGHDRDQIQALSKQFGCRQIAFEALYTMFHDVLALTYGGGDGEGPEVRPGYLKPGMTVLDLTALPRKSAFIGEATGRGCVAVEPERVLVEQARRLVRQVTGQEVAAEALAGVFAGLVDDEGDQPQG
jgi:3-dehydroquinate dehydratase/shikimate dehydrogenase